MWQRYYSATDTKEVIELLAEHRERTRIVAGATDLILELERGVRSGVELLVDVTRIPGLKKVVLDEDGWIHRGPLVTHNDCVGSQLIREYALPLAQAAWEVGAPQIRNRGTIAGNLITASPANDTIPPLMAMGAQVRLRSASGDRDVALDEFYTGVRGTVMQPDEMLVDITFPALKPNQRGMFIKLGLRRAQAIAVVNAAVVITFSEPSTAGRIEDVAITLGSVAPTIVHARNAEAHLRNYYINADTIAQAAQLAMTDASPIDDLRGSAGYRREMVRVCVSRSLHAILAGEERRDFPTDPVLLDTRHKNGEVPVLNEALVHEDNQPIITRINGERYEFKTGQRKTLLRLLREEGGLIGTKEGCAEGECGACTILLDGMAVMSCLVPAARAHGAEIVTIEGLARDGELHPVQQAFVDEGAVQCGYCTPGFIMSAAMLLEEAPDPTLQQIQTSVTGNLCRCTGYYKIVQAIEKASQIE